MNDHEEQPTLPENQEPEEETPTSDDLTTSPMSDDIDVEGALAAVASLHTLTQVEAEADEDEERDIAEPEDESFELATEGAAEEAVEMPVAESFVPAPVITPVQDDRLVRGQAASVVPAFLLMGIGAVLIFLLTTGGALPATPILVGVGLLALGVILLSRWLSSRAAGNLFSGLLLAFFGAGVLFLELSATFNWAQGGLLLLVAPGLALLLSAMLTPGSRSASLFGMILTVAAIATLLVNQALPTWEATIASLWPVALGLALVLLIAPFVRRRRNS